MRSRSIWMLGLASGLVGVVVALASADGLRSAPARRPPQAHARRTGPAVVSRELLRGFNPLQHHVDGERLVSDLPNGNHVELTLDPGLQAFTEDVLEEYRVPFGALVAMDPHTGRVLAYVSHSSANPNAGDLVLDPTPPTASVFKVITGSALIDSGQTPSTRVCYGGGEHRLSLNDITDNPAHRNCATLAQAMGGSINAIFAKLSDQHLNPATLERYASAFGFGQTLPFDFPTRPSPAEVPTERLEFARTSAGFWHMHMSPLHAALIGATIANDGVMPRAFMVERVIDNDRGILGVAAAPSAFRSVIPAATARTVNQMMRMTVTEGTSRRTFHDPAGHPFLPGIEIAGKTGTLSAENPYRGYTWWVGFAPADHPTIAVAALIVNTPNWRIKANFLAREALRYYLVEAPATRARAAARAAAAAPATPATPAAPTVPATPSRTN
ncbi:MAG: penicillin-binding protein [Sandaracinaceae bacterium]|nr:penicillin-binding protein [Sandaracinaceae bacterium]